MKFVVPYPYPGTVEQTNDNVRYLADSLNDGAHELAISTSVFNNITVQQSGLMSNVTFNRASGVTLVANSGNLTWLSAGTLLATTGNITSATIGSATITSGNFTQGLYAGSGTMQNLYMSNTVKFPSNGVAASQILMMNNTTDSPTPAEDGFKVRWQNTGIGWGANNDALIFEKTDANDDTPDGGFQFAMTGQGATQVVVMQMMGTAPVNFMSAGATTSGTFDATVLSAPTGNISSGTIQTLINATHASITSASITTMSLGYAPRLSAATIFGTSGNFDSATITSGNFTGGVSIQSGTIQTLISPLATITSAVIASGNFNGAKISGALVLDNGATNGGAIYWNGGNTVIDSVDAGGDYRQFAGTLQNQFFSRNDSPGVISLHSYDNATPANGSTYYGVRARGTLTAPAVVVAGDTILSLQAFPRDGDGWCSEIPASIDFKASATITSSAVPAGISFLTGDGATARTERLRITSDGDIYSIKNTLFSSTVTGWDAGFSQKIYTKMFGNLMLCNYAISGTSTADYSRFTLPYSAASVPAAQFHTPCAALNSGAGAAGAMASIAANQNVMNIYANQASGAWIATGRKTAKGQFFMEVAL